MHTLRAGKLTVLQVISGNTENTSRLQELAVLTLPELPRRPGVLSARHPYYLNSSLRKISYVVASRGLDITLA